MSRSLSFTDLTLMAHGDFELDMAKHSRRSVLCSVRFN